MASMYEASPPGNGDGKLVKSICLFSDPFHFLLQCGFRLLRSDELMLIVNIYGKCLEWLRQGWAVTRYGFELNETESFN